MGSFAPPSTGDNLLQVWFNGSDELAALLSRRNVELTRLGGAQGRTWFASANIADLEFQSVSTVGRYRVRGTVPGGTVTMQFDLGSGGQRRIGGQALDGDDVGVAFGGAQFDFLSAERHYGMSLTLPEILVTEALQHRAPAAETSMRGGPQQVIANCGPWAAAVRTLASSVFAPSGRPTAPRFQEHARADLSDMLVAMLLLPWSRSNGATFRSLHYQRVPIVRRVEEFMRSKLGEPLMLHDICRAANASERAVEYAFRDVCGMGPKQYLKMLRLKQVRRELKTLPVDAATVTTIAFHYGFWHMGHFSEAYRQLFDETPGQTRHHRT